MYEEHNYRRGGCGGFVDGRESGNAPQPPRHDVARQEEVMRAAADAGKLPGKRLKDHDRKEPTLKAQKKMMEMFSEGV